ncbi:hypothetical protein ACLOJK_037801 [Asimina triloba]
MPYTVICLDTRLAAASIEDRTATDLAIDGVEAQMRKKPCWRRQWTDAMYDGWVLLHEDRKATILIDGHDCWPMAGLRRIRWSDSAGSCGFFPGGGGGGGSLETMKFEYGALAARQEFNQDSRLGPAKSSGRRQSEQRHKDPGSALVESFLL